MRQAPRVSLSVLWLLGCLAVAISSCTTLAPTPARVHKVIPRPAMRWVPTPHFRPGSRTPETVDAIAVHTTEGGFNRSRDHARNQRQVYFGTISYFRNNKRKVSAHFVVGPDGSITQMVREADIAHTTTYYNRRSFGIECAGWSAREATWTPELLDALVELCAYLAVTWDIPVVHPEGTAYEGPNRRPTKNPERPRFDAPGIVGHFQIQPWNKSDPGAHFPWAEFMRRLEARVEGAEPQHWERLRPPMNRLASAFPNGQAHAMSPRIEVLARPPATDDESVSIDFLIDAKGEIVERDPFGGRIALIREERISPEQTRSLLALLAYLGARRGIRGAAWSRWVSLSPEVAAAIPEDWVRIVRQRWEAVGFQSSDPGERTSGGSARKTHPAPR